MNDKLSKKAEEWYNSFESTKDWCSYKGLSRGSIEAYYMGLKTYCEYRNKTPDELRSEVLSIGNGESAAGHASKLLVDYQKYLVKLKTKRGTPFSPSAVLSYKNAAQSFYAFILNHKISVPNQVAKGERARDKHIPTREELRRMVDLCDVRETAYLLCQASTGLRIGDMLALTIGKVKDVLKEETEYVVIGYVPQKRGNIIGPRHTILPPFGVKAVRNYLNLRKEIGEEFHSWTPLFPSPMNRDEPIVAAQINKIIKRVVQEAGILTPMEVEDHVKLTSQELRAYFGNCLENAGMIRSHVDYMMAHKTNNYFGAYLNITPKMILADYKEYLWAVDPYYDAEKQKIIEECDSLQGRLDMHEKRLEMLESVQVENVHARTLSGDDNGKWEVRILSNEAEIVKYAMDGWDISPYL
jgi:integrase